MVCLRFSPLRIGEVNPSSSVVIDRISEATNKALKDPEVLKELERQGLNALGGSPDDFANFIKSETQRWAQVIHGMDAAKNMKAGNARP